MIHSHSTLGNSDSQVLQPYGSVTPQSFYPSAGWLLPGWNDSPGNQWTPGSRDSQCVRCSISTATRPFTKYDYFKIKLAPCVVCDVKWTILVTLNTMVVQFIVLHIRLEENERWKWSHSSINDVQSQDYTCCKTLAQETCVNSGGTCQWKFLFAECFGLLNILSH